MKRVLIIGASGGIGGAMSSLLASKAQEVTCLSRSADQLDLCDETSVERALGQLEGHYDLIFVATGALEITGRGPEKTLKSLTPDALHAQFALNTVGPIMVLKHALPLFSKDRQTVFAALSARVGSITDNGLGGWYSYRASKAGLNQLIRTSAIELARSHPKSVVIALHPGTVKTALTQKYLSRHPAVEPEEAAQNLLNVIGGLSPDQSGGFYDWAGKQIPW